MARKERDRVIVAAGLEETKANSVRRQISATCSRNDGVVDLGTRASADLFTSSSGCSNPTRSSRPWPSTAWCACAWARQPKPKRGLDLCDRFGGQRFLPVADPLSRRLQSMIAAAGTPVGFDDVLAVPDCVRDRSEVASAVQACCGVVIEDVAMM